MKKLICIFFLLPVFCIAQTTTKPIGSYDIYSGNPAGNRVLGIIPGTNGTYSTRLFNTNDLTNRSYHTGVQAIATISGLQAILDNKVNAVTGKVLSDNNFTTAQMNKINQLLYFTNFTTTGTGPATFDGNTLNIPTNNGTTGPQGPQGPAGPQGATGPQGPAGPAGGGGGSGGTTELALSNQFQLTGQKLHLFGDSSVPTVSPGSTMIGSTSFIGHDRFIVATLTITSSSSVNPGDDVLVITFGQPFVATPGTQLTLYGAYLNMYVETVSTTQVVIACGASGALAPGTYRFSIKSEPL